MSFVKKMLYPTLLILILSASIIISIIPDFYRVSTTPVDATFPLVHNNQEDYFYYLSLMRQGLEGRWKITSRMTPEKFPPVFVQTIFAVLGHSARSTGLSLVSVYFASRLIFGILLMLVSYLLIRHLFHEKRFRIAAFFLVSLATGFWTIGKVNGTTQLIQYLTYWTRLDPILRTTYLPHHQFSTIAGILSLFFLARSFERRSIRVGILAAVLGFLSGLVYFATMVNILGGIAIATVLFLLKNRVTNIHKAQPYHFHLVILFFYTLSALFSLLYLLSLSKNVFPWSNYNNLAGQFTFFIPWMDYLAALGPSGLLTAIGLPLMLSTKDVLPLLLLGWSIFPIIGIFAIHPYVPQYGTVYFLEATSYIPLGILAVFGLKTIEKRIKIKWITPVILLLLLFYSIPPLKSSIEAENVRLLPNRYNIFISKDVMRAFEWLDKNSPPESIVLSGGYFGVIIPAFTHNRMVNGHPKNTFQPAQKTHDILLFFSGKDIPESAKILSKYRVSYVFYSYDTDPPPQEFLDKLGLLPIFAATNVKIYKTSVH